MAFRGTGSGFLRWRTSPTRSPPFWLYSAPPWESVQCAGSGRLTADRVGDFDNHFPVEVALFRLRDSPVIADVTMSFFQTARAYTEGFCVYGDRMGVEWPQHEGGPLTTFELGRPPRRATGPTGCNRADLEPGEYGHLLPSPLAAFTRPHALDPEAGAHRCR